MGYIKTINYRGLPVINAYHRIDATSSSNGLCEASINIYVSRDAFLNGEGYLEQHIVSYPIKYGETVGADKNQGYEYLMELEENKEAVVVREDE